MKPKPSLPSLKSISPYKGGNVFPEGFVNNIFLASNENPYGPSPKLLDSFLELPKTINTYPDGEAKILRRALAKHYGLKDENFLVSCGSEEALQLIARTFATQGDEVLFAEHAFALYKISTLAVGATPITFNLNSDFTLCVEKILEKLTDKTKVIYLDHPGNPIGRYLTIEQIQELLKRTPSNVIVVFDSAYAEYMDDINTYECGVSFIKQYSNVVVTRSFSKAYGLANLRLGYMISNAEIIDWVNRIRLPFNVSGLSQVLGLAALKDQAWIQTCCENNKKVFHYTQQSLAKLNIFTLPFYNNFLMAKFENPKKVYLFLGENGVIVRPMDAYGLSDYLRITIGTEHKMQQFIDILSKCPHQ